MTVSSMVERKLLGKRVHCHGKFFRDTTPQVIAQTFGATTADMLDRTVDLLVLPTLTGYAAPQKKAKALNAKGAAIQVMGFNAFKDLVRPSPTELTGMIREGASAAFNKVVAAVATCDIDYDVTGESFDGLELKGFDFNRVRFNGCSFVGAHLEGTQFERALNCDFSDVRSDYLDGVRGSGSFGDVNGSRFLRANLRRISFLKGLAGTDFTAATLDRATIFSEATSQDDAPVFNHASMKETRLYVRLPGAQFEQVDFTGTVLKNCNFSGGNFRGAIFKDVAFEASNFAGADFANADLRGTILCEADLRHANFDGTQLKGSNLRGAKLDGARLSKALDLPMEASTPAFCGPAVRELERVAAASDEIDIQIMVSTGAQPEGELLQINSLTIAMGYGVKLPASCRAARQLGKITFSAGIQRAADYLPNKALRFETLVISTKKCKMPRKALRELVTQALKEAFGHQREGSTP